MNLLIYAVCSGLNRGAALLYFPFLIVLLSIEDFGIWSVSFVTANLLSPILSLGGVNSIIREGSEIDGEEVAIKLTVNFLITTTVLSALCSLLVLSVEAPEWLLFSVLMGCGFSIFDTLGAFTRAIEKSVTFLIISLSRVLALLFAIIIGLLYDLVFLDLLKLQAVFIIGLSFLSVISLYMIGALRSNSNSRLEMLTHYRFSISLIPHSVFQWVSSSSDRLIINSIMGPYATGIYSLLYNIASVLMLANSALSLYIQPYIIKNFKVWSFDGKALRWFTYYSFLVISLYIITVFLLVADSYLGYVFDSYTKSTIWIFTFIYLGIYFLGAYTFYVPWLYYGRHIKSITNITIGVGILNVCFTIFFVSRFGLIGGGLSTFLAYAAYFIAVRYQVLNLIGSLNFKSVKMILSTTAIITILSCLITILIKT